MDFIEILLRVSFLIALAGLGYGVGRCFKIDPKQISTLLVYIIVPVMMFVSIIQAPKNDAYYGYIIGAYCVSALMATFAFRWGRYLFKDNTRNLFAYTAGTGNTGFFGLPLVIALFDASGVAIAVCWIIGSALYEFTYGYYLTARGQFTVTESLKRVCKIPLMYAFALAMFLVNVDMLPHPIIIESLNNFKGAYSILGMMVIGLTLATLTHFELDLRFLMVALSWKFLMWPLLGFIIIYCGADFFDRQTQVIIMLFSSVPMSVSTVVVANSLGVHPEKAATTVMISTCLSLLTVPLILSFMA